MKIEVNFSKAHLIVLVTVLLLTLTVAYGTNNPSNFGHSAGEIEGVCKSDGTGCPTFSNNKNLTSLTFSGTSVSCPTGTILYHAQDIGSGQNHGINVNYQTGVCNSWEGNANYGGHGCRIYCLSLN